MDKIKNKCKDCKFYIKHYIIRHCSYYPLDMGHCANGNVSARTAFKRVESNSLCEYFAPMEEKIAEQQEHIINTINYMQKNLNEIAIILKENFEYLKNKTPDE